MRQGTQYPLLTPSWALGIKQTHYNFEELYFMLLVTSAVRTLLSISRNRINQITSNNLIDNHINKHIVNASRLLAI